MQLESQCRLRCRPSNQRVCSWNLIQRRKERSISGLSQLAVTCSMLPPPALQASVEARDYTPGRRPGRGARPRNARSKLTPEGFPADSLAMAPGDLTNLVLNRVAVHAGAGRRHQCDPAHRAPARGFRPAPHRSVAECFHNGDRLRAEPGQPRPGEHNKLWEERRLESVMNYRLTVGLRGPRTCRNGCISRPCLASKRAGPIGRSGRLPLTGAGDAEHGCACYARRRSRHRPNG